MKRQSSLEISGSGIITQQQFDTYSDQWMSLISGPGGDTLQQIFRSGKTENVLTYAGFTINQMISLVSTVGAAHIKVRYLLDNDDPSTPRFILALFATDSMDKRLSPYYVANDYARILVPPPSDKATVEPLGESLGESSSGYVAHILAQEWASNWSALHVGDSALHVGDSALPVGDSALPVDDVVPALFTNSYGPMKGYNFQLNDFTRLFMRVASFDNQVVHHVVRADFGLHKYENPEGGAVATFGLILRMYEVVDGVAKVSSAPFYDMASPCPPICGSN